MLNHIAIQGRFVRDPDLRKTGSGTSVASFTLACDRDYGEKQTDFIDCVVWRQSAEFVSKYFHKGNQCIVTGSLQSRKYEDKNEVKRTAWEIIVDHVYFCESKKQTQDVEYTELPDDGEELPF